MQRVYHTYNFARNFISDFTYTAPRIFLTTLLQSLCISEQEQEQHTGEQREHELEGRSDFVRSNEPHLQTRERESGDSENVRGEARQVCALPQLHPPNFLHLVPQAILPKTQNPKPETRNPKPETQNS